MRLSRITTTVVVCFVLSLCACSSGPSGETIACHVVHRPLLSGPYTLGIYVMNGDGRERREVGEGRYPDWSPDGGRLVFVGADGESLDVLDLTTRDTTLLVRLGGLIKDPAWSPDGEWIAFRVLYEDIWTINADGSNAHQLTNYADGTCVGHPSWSPDASRIAFSMSPDCWAEERRSDVYVMNSDGSNVIRLTDGMGNYWDPLWSPAGDRMLFAEYHDGESSICVMNADGSGKIRLGTGRPYSWSPDGTRIYYHQVGINALWTMNVDGSNPRRLFTLPCEEPAWSPVVEGQEAVE
jgi:TolB protein